jgi:hypothetical protein
MNRFRYIIRRTTIQPLPSLQLCPARRKFRHAYMVASCVWNRPVDRGVDDEVESWNVRLVRGPASFLASLYLMGRKVL